MHHVREIGLPDRRIARCWRCEGLPAKHVKDATSQLSLKFVRLHGADAATRTDGEQLEVDFRGWRACAAEPDSTAQRKPCGGAAYTLEEFAEFAPAVE